MKYNTLKLKTSKKICKFALYALFMTGSGQYAMAMRSESTTEYSAQKSPAQTHTEDLNAKIQATHQHITQDDIQATDTLVTAHEEQSANAPSFDELDSIPDDSSKANGFEEKRINGSLIQTFRDKNGKVSQIMKTTILDSGYTVSQLVDSYGNKTITTIDKNKNKVEKDYKSGAIIIKNIEDERKPIAYYYDNGDKTFRNDLKGDQQFTSIKANGDMNISNKDGSIETETNENGAVTTSTKDSKHNLVSKHAKVTNSSDNSLTTEETSYYDNNMVKSIKLTKTNGDETTFFANPNGDETEKTEKAGDTLTHTVYHDLNNSFIKTTKNGDKTTVTSSAGKTVTLKSEKGLTTIYDQSGKVSKIFKNGKDITNDYLTRLYHHFFGDKTPMTQHDSGAFKSLGVDINTETYKNLFATQSAK